MHKNSGCKEEKMMDGFTSKTSKPGWSRGKHSGFLTQGSMVQTLSQATLNC